MNKASGEITMKTRNDSLGRRAEMDFKIIAIVVIMVAIMLIVLLAGKRILSSFG